MTNATSLLVFASALPGLEPALADELSALGFPGVRSVPGGAEFRGGWPDVWRANLWSACAGAVLIRLARFEARHLRQLDERARRVAWPATLRPGTRVLIEASASASKLYHTGAIAERVATALEAARCLPVTDREAAEARVLVRIVRDRVTISLDTSGTPLFRRGYKRDVGAAPLRETMAAAFLRMAGHEGGSVLDPFCGSGTIPIEAAARAAGLAPGRDRTFAFEKLRTFDGEAWSAMREEGRGRREVGSAAAFAGSDRDADVVAAARSNAERAGLADLVRFEVRSVSEAAPEGSGGLVLTNPPYGERLGEAKALAPLYRAFGGAMRTRFGGWRVGLVTSEERLAHATGLDWAARSAPIPHGPLKVQLWTTGVLRG